MPKKPLEPELLPVDVIHALPAEAAERVRRIRRITRLMDEAVRIPGTNYRVGLDGLIGLVPGAGDVATTAVAAWLVRESARLGVPRHKLARMVGNILLDMAAGSVPVVGDLFDLAFKANRKNLAILEEHLESLQPREATVPPDPPSFRTAQRERTQVLDR